MKTLLLFLLIVNCAPIWAQEPVIPAKETIVAVPDEPAQFPGGNEALRKFLAENLVYLQRAAEEGLSGQCYIQLLITEDGTITNPKVKHGVPDCPECDAEAMRLVKLMPKWIPGKIEGKAVNSLYYLPISFYVQ